jgi:hypothetical protein
MKRGGDFYGKGWTTITKMRVEDHICSFDDALHARASRSLLHLHRSPQAVVLATDTRDPQVI